MIDEDVQTAGLLYLGSRIKESLISTIYPCDGLTATQAAYVAGHVPVVPGSN